MTCVLGSLVVAAAAPARHNRITDDIYSLASEVGGVPPEVVWFTHGSEVHGNDEARGAPC